MLLLDVERPALAALLAARGLTVRGGHAQHVVALVGERTARPACPAVVQVRSPDAAGALLDGGADDVVLASDPDTLVAARVAALVRRVRPEMVRVGEVAIDPLEQRVTLAGEPLALLPREYKLLYYLARHAGTVVSQPTLHQAIWGRDFHPGTNVIAVHVSRLRGKLANSGVAVITERGRGYRLVIAARGGAG